MSTAYSHFAGPPGIGPIPLPLASLSTAQFLGMIEAGLLDPERHVELIGGLISPMAPAGPEHNGSIISFTRIFSPLVDRFELAVQATLQLGEGHVFDPDFMLLRRRPEGYRRALPQPADVLLVVEAAAASLDRDRYVKLPAYAAAGIAEYWIADVVNMTLGVFRLPTSDAYREEQTLAGDQTVSPLAAPELTIRVGDLFR